jgi:hypothetical protein
MSDVTKMSELVDFVDEIIDDTNGDVEIYGMTYNPSYILKECDPVAYRSILLDIADNNEIDVDDLVEDYKV